MPSTLRLRPVVVAAGGRRRGRRGCRYCRYNWRALLPDERVGQPPRLLLFSRSGFAAGLAAEAAARPDVELVDLERLYQGR